MPLETPGAFSKPGDWISISKGIRGMGAILEGAAIDTTPRRTPLSESGCLDFTARDPLRGSTSRALFKIPDESSNA